MERGENKLFTVYPGWVKQCTMMFPFHLQLTLNNAKGMGVNPPRLLKSMYNFWLPQNLTTNSLLLTGSLTNTIHSRLKHLICYVYYILYSYKK